MGGRCKSTRVGVGWFSQVVVEGDANSMDINLCYMDVETKIGVEFTP